MARVELDFHDVASSHAYGAERRIVFSSTLTLSYAKKDALSRGGNN